MDYRRWRTWKNPAGEEIISDVVEFPGDGPKAHERAKRVARGTPTSMTLAVVTAIPAGTAASTVGAAKRRRELVAFAKRESRNALGRARRRAPVWQQQPDPDPFIQVGERPLLRWREVLAKRDATRRRARIDRTKNELAFNYAWGRAVEPYGYILEEIQRHMLEPVGDLGRTWFDPFWTRDEVLDWLENRVNRFLLETGALREQVTLPATAILQIPEGNEVRRAVYVAADGTTTPLEIGDFHAKDQARPGWGGDAAGTPDTLLLWGQGLARLTPPPSGGTVLLDVVPHWTAREEEWQRGSYWSDPTLSGVWPGASRSLPVPAIFYPFIKYGVMADMLGKEGEAQDMDRAQYCEGRFTEGVELAKMLLGRK